MIGLLEPGDRLEHLLVLDRRLGGSGIVYVTKDLRDDAHESGRPLVLAAKTLWPELAKDPARVSQFEAECRAWLYLGQHKHVVRLFYADRLSGQPFAFAEYVPQRGFPHTLRGWLDHHLLEFESAVRFGAQMTRALLFATGQGLVAHGDITPENVMVTPSGVAKVTDWGLSRLDSAPGVPLPSVTAAPYRRGPHSSQAGTRGHGTRGYAAPEVLKAETGASAAADLFGLGVVLAEMLTGRCVPAGTSTAQLLPHLDALALSRRTVFADALASCLSPRPQDRPTVAEIEALLAAAFEEVVGVPFEPSPTSAEEHYADRGQRAYGLLMLGHIDEGMRVQAELMRDMRRIKEPNPPTEEERAPFILMDYKEHGWVTIVPQEHLDEAEEHLRAHADDLEVIRDARSTFMLAGRPERVLELCHAELELRPEDTKALKDAAYALEKLGRSQEAIGFLDRILAREPTVQLWWDRAVLCEAEGDSEQELWSVTKGLELEPSHCALLNRRGNVYMRGGKWTDAAESFRQASEADPEDALVFFNLGTALTHLQRFEEAVVALARALEITPHFVQALNTLGTVFLLHGGHQEAARYFQRAIAIDPEYAKAWFNMGQIYEDWQQPDTAREAYQRALDLDPGYQRAQDALARLNA
ncbi:tetratricopeptide repeat protein [Streptomyces sp. NPDC096176]|uniref:tetratricopeptide repeat protein n=1 Tax=Streptomyces sp. NPDC096176 TaxID=3366079 RepID=UPI003813F487